MREEWSLDKSAVKIYGDFSPHPIIVTKDVAQHFGGTEEAFFAFQRFRNEDILPKVNAGERHPFTMKDVRYALQNREKGYRHWRFGRLQGYNEYIVGYYYIEGDEAVFEDGQRWSLPESRITKT